MDLALAVAAGAVSAEVVPHRGHRGWLLEVEGRSAAFPGHRSQPLEVEDHIAKLANAQNENLGGLGSSRGGSSHGSASSHLSQSRQIYEQLKNNQGPKSHHGPPLCCVPRLRHRHRWIRRILQSLQLP